MLMECINGSQLCSKQTKDLSTKSHPRANEKTNELKTIDFSGCSWSPMRERASNLRRRMRKNFGCSRFFILILIFAPVACDVIQSYHAMVVTFECYCNMKYETSDGKQWQFLPTFPDILKMFSTKKLLQPQ